MTITGNLIFRSGKHAELNTLDSCHIRIEDAHGITVIANTMNAGRDDGEKGKYSPSYGIVYRHSRTALLGQRLAPRPLAWVDRGQG